MRPEDTSPESNTNSTQPTEVSNTEAITANKPLVDADNETDTVATALSAPADPFTKPSFDTFPTPVEPASTPVIVGGSRSKKPLLIGLAAAVIAVLGGGYAAYAMWWNAPNKVVDDALASIMVAKDATAKGALNITGEKGYKLSLTFDAIGEEKKSSADLGFSMTNEGTTVDMGGSFVVDNSSTYVKLKDVKKAIEKISGGQPEMMTYFDPILSKIDNKWVLVTADDINRLSGSDSASNKEVACVQNVLGEGLRTNKTYQKEVSDTYQKNRFIFVKESKGIETIDGAQSNHYVMGLDEDKAIAFGNAIVNTTVFKAVDDCVKQDLKKDFLDSNKKGESSKTDATTELWVNTWTHKPTKIKVTANDPDSSSKTIIESTFKFDTGKKVTVPKADTTVKDIEAEVEKLQQELMVPASYGYDVDSL